MPELHWMAYTTNFITSDERALLKMPADRDLAAYDTGRGYTMTVLEEAHDNVDPLALKRFRQSAISSSLGKRVLAIDKAMKAADSAKSSSSSSKKQKVDFSANQTAAEKKKTSGQNSQNSKSPSRPMKKLGRPAAPTSPTPTPTSTLTLHLPFPMRTACSMPLGATTGRPAASVGDAGTA